MIIQHKRRILTVMVETLDDEKILDEMMNLAVQSAFSTPAQKIARQKHSPRKVTIYDREYPSLRYACLNTWGMTEGAYLCVANKHRRGTPLEALLPRLDDGDGAKNLLMHSEKGKIVVRKHKERS